ncbi:rhodanese-like domain-containing protein, partial [Enterobacter cloacae subsp. cloacae]
MSYVTEFPAAEPQEAVTHFLRRLSVETDCADVHHALTNNEQDFVLLHVVGKPEQFARRHVPGAIHMPWSQITEARMAQWPADTLFVVYCAGPHCNGADRAALKLA